LQTFFIFNNSYSDFLTICGRLQMRRNNGDDDGDDDDDDGGDDDFLFACRRSRRVIT